MPYEIVAELIKKHEGLKLKPYKCAAGKLTIGYGRNLEDNGISESEAEMLLATDIQNAYFECSKFPFWEKLNDYRKAVLIDMCYNIGITRLKQFKKMLSALEREDYNTSASEMLDSKWALQVKSRAYDLSEIMKKGVM